MECSDRLGLAVWAPVGASPCQLFTLYRGPATVARLPSTSVHGCLPPVVAIHAFEISEIAEGGSTCTDALLQHCCKASAESIELWAFEMTCLGVRCNSCCEQAFIGVDVPCTSNDGLVEKCCFDGAFAVLQALLQIGTVEARAEGLRPQSLESGDDRFHWLTRRNPPHFTKAAHVDKTQLMSLRIPKAHSGVPAGL